ncbi:hypothetical protein AGMMS49949_05520 [Alphaproteobacteria bacterium]|nr:hypothetical protein AGMMS49949_05520 [Alphaproteobacteria bacterium]GHS97744.1 hypothetical protein AGMMS50296_4980 [Alphaproteobacteria bacterium]
MMEGFEQAAALVDQSAEDLDKAPGDKEDPPKEEKPEEEDSFLKKDDGEAQEKVQDSEPHASAPSSVQDSSERKKGTPPPSSPQDYNALAKSGDEEEPPAPYAEPLTAGSHDKDGNVKEKEKKGSEEDAEKEEGKEGASPEESTEEGWTGKAGELLEGAKALAPSEEAPPAPEEPTEEEPKKNPDPPPEDGPFEYFDDAGDHYVVTYAGGVLTGPFSIFNKDEQPKMEAGMKGGKLDGVGKTYENGIVRTEFEMKEGVLHGVCREFNEEGILVAEMTFVEGQKQGEMKQYHPDGETVALSSTFNADKRSGKCESFSRQGQIQLRTFYEDDQIHGAMENFYTGLDGNGLMRLASYAKGLLDGEEKVYHASGRILSQAEYKEGALKKKRDFPPPR